MKENEPVKQNGRFKKFFGRFSEANQVNSFHTEAEEKVRKSKHITVAKTSISKKQRKQEILQK